MQPTAYFIVFLAYQEFMGCWQWWFGLLVCVREAVYVAVTLLGVAYMPVFLLFQPNRMKLHDQYPQLFGIELVYFATPKYLVTDLINVSSKKQQLQTFVCLTTLLSFMGHIAAFAALVCGLVAPIGVMWPAMGVGYLMSILAIPVEIYLCGSGWKV